MSGRISPTNEILRSPLFTGLGQAEFVVYLKIVTSIANDILAKCQNLQEGLKEPIGKRLDYSAIRKTFSYETSHPTITHKVEEVSLGFSELTLAPRVKKTLPGAARPNPKDIADQQIRQEMTEAALALAAIRRIGDSAERLFEKAVESAVKTGAIFGPTGQAAVFSTKLLRAVNQEADTYLTTAKKVVQVVLEKTQGEITPDFVKAVPARAQKTGAVLHQSFGLDPKVGDQSFKDATKVATDAAMMVAGAGVARAFKGVTPKVTKVVNSEAISREKLPVFAQAETQPIIKRAHIPSSLIKPELIVPNGPIIARVRNPLRDSMYFHATDLDGLFGILNSKSINRSARSDGYYVGTAPNLQFGNFVILLNEKAAKGNTIGYTAPIKDNVEIGFVRPIAATEETIEAIAVIDGIDREVLATRVAAIAKRRIPIIPLDKVEKELWKRKNP